MKPRYKRIRGFNMWSMFFYASKSFGIVFHLIACKLRKKDASNYLTSIRYVNIVRETCNYFSEKDSQNRSTLRAYYKINDNRIDIRVRFYKKAVESDYERFRESVELHTYTTTRLQQEKTYQKFSIVLNIEPLMDYEADRSKVTIGTGIYGLIYWLYAECPHLLIVGPTRNGKTSLMKYLLNGVFKASYDVYMVDGKAVDYANDIDNFKYYVSNTNENYDDIIYVVKKFHTNMLLRIEDLKAARVNNYIDVSSIEPRFLIIDEFEHILDSLNKKQMAEIQLYINAIVKLGGAFGCFLVVSMQRPDAELLGGRVRENFMTKVVVGDAGAETYQMMFKQSSLKPLARGKAWYRADEESLNIIAIPFYKKIQETVTKKEYKSRKEQPDESDGE